MENSMNEASHGPLMIYLMSTCMHFFLMEEKNKHP